MFNSKVYRFFNTQGIISIRSVTPEHLAGGRAEWDIETDSPESLFQFGKNVWHLGTLSKTLKAQSCDRESRSEGEKILKRLQATETAK